MSTPISPPPSRPGLVSRPSSMATISKTILLVTGGNTGIGYHIVKSLSQQPNAQVLMGCRDTEKGEAAVATMGAPVNVNPIQLDITDDESIERCVKAVEQLFGRLDVLVNNAGTAGLDLKRDGHTPSRREEWHHVMNVNTTSTGVFTDAMIPLLKKSKLPKIVFISSAAGSIGRLQSGSNLYPAVPYYASKTAVNMMAVWYARAHPNFKVNAVCPGFRATKLNDAELTEDTNPELGAVRAVKLINEGADGATGTFSNVDGPLPW